MASRNLRWRLTEDDIARLAGLALRVDMLRSAGAWAPSPIWAMTIVSTQANIDYAKDVYSHWPRRSVFEGYVNWHAGLAGCLARAQEDNQ
jgi:hypothetical protein